MTKFATRPVPPNGLTGHPRRAVPCRCERPLPDEDDMCLGCGRYASEAISQTWSEQAAATALPMEPGLA